MVGAVGLDQREIPVHIVTDEFVLKGELHFKGVLHVTLNNESLETMSLFQAQAQALDADNVAAQMNVEEIVVVRSHCQLIAFAERLSQEDYTLRTTPHPAIVYTSRFAIQGDLAMGPSDRFIDVMEDLKGYFLPVLDAHIYPLFPVRAQVPRQAEMVLIYRDHVKMMQDKGQP